MKKQAATVGIPSAFYEGKPVVMPSIPNVRVKRVLDQKAKRLIGFRDRMGLTNDKFCEVLGIEGPRLYSYLYGKVVPPDWIVETAEKICERDKKIIDEVSRLFSRPARDIVHDWMRLVGANPEDERTAIAMLSGVIDVDVLTIRRWLSGEVKIRPPRGKVYHGRIVAYLTRIKMDETHKIADRPI